MVTKIALYLQLRRLYRDH